MTCKVVVNDTMQQGYVYYCTEPVGGHFAPGFTPQLTPKEMLRAGVFGGKYMTDCRAEFPASWFARARLCAERHNPRLNYFGVNASQSLAVWRRNDWIHPQDPRGWFQWYCRYYMGRRTRDDARQIRRWRAIARHVASQVTWIAGGGSGRRSCTGPTTAGRFNRAFRKRKKGLSWRLVPRPWCPRFQIPAGIDPEVLAVGVVHAAGGCEWLAMCRIVVLLKRPSTASFPVQITLVRVHLSLAGGRQAASS